MPVLASPFLRRIWLVLGCAAAFAPVAVRAQAVAQPGAHVRIFAPSAADSLLTGTVVAIDSASLLLAPRASGGSRSVPLQAIERLEVRRRGRRSTLEGALLGTAIGATAGYLVASAYPRRSECDYDCGLAEAAGFVLGGFSGLVVGASIGTRHRDPDRWEPGRLPAPAARGAP